MTGRVVAITGGARGIGLAIARAVAAGGDTVAIGDLDESAARSAAAGLPGAASGHRLDVADRDSYTAFVQAAETAHGPVDVLVNNAGVMWVGRYDAEPASATRRMVDVNLLGVIHGIQAVTPAMRRRRRGQVVTIASAASKIAPAGEATYTATKHAVYGYCAAVRTELRGTGVEISIVLPTVVDTELAAGTSAGSVRRLAPEEVAAAVVRVIRRPRFEVFVPRRVNALTRLLAVLPQSARDALTARAVPDQVHETDAAQRTDYERRHLG